MFLNGKAGKILYVDWRNHHFGVYSAGGNPFKVVTFFQTLAFCVFYCNTVSDRNYLGINLYMFVETNGVRLDKGSTRVRIRFFVSVQTSECDYSIAMEAMTHHPCPFSFLAHHPSAFILQYNVHGPKGRQNGCMPILWGFTIWIFWMR